MSSSAASAQNPQETKVDAYHLRLPHKRGERKGQYSKIQTVTKIQTGYNTVFSYQGDIYSKSSEMAILEIQEDKTRLKNDLDLCEKEKANYKTALITCVVALIVVATIGGMAAGVLGAPHSAFAHWMTHTVKDFFAHNLGALYVTGGMVGLLALGLLGNHLKKKYDAKRAAEAAPVIFTPEQQAVLAKEKEQRLADVTLRQGGQGNPSSAAQNNLHLLDRSDEEERIDPLANNLNAVSDETSDLEGV